MTSYSPFQRCLLLIRDPASLFARVKDEPLRYALLTFFYVVVPVLLFVWLLTWSSLVVVGYSVIVFFLFFLFFIFYAVILFLMGLLFSITLSWSLIFALLLYSLLPFVVLVWIPYMWLVAILWMLVLQYFFVVRALQISSSRGLLVLLLSFAFLSTLFFFLFRIFL